MEEFDYQTSTLGELLLWGVFSLFLLILAVVSGFVAEQFLDFGDKEIAATIAVSVLLSGVWGAWGAMIWTRSSALRLVLMGVAVIPGALMLGGGIWAFLAMPENRWVWRWGWLILAGHGAGAVIATIAIGSRGMLQKVSREVRQRRLAMSWTLYPILLMAGNFIVLVLVLKLAPELFLRGGDGFFASLARWMIPVQGLVLMSTVLPAFWALLCRALTRRPSSKA